MLKTEEKELLMEDLNARISTDTLVRVIDDGFVMVCKLTKDILPFVEDWDIHPYLRPMESMTEEEQREYNIAIDKDVEPERIVDWYNIHHFDYRGLIEKGLALPATDGMYNNIITKKYKYGRL